MGFGAVKDRIAERDSEVTRLHTKVAEVKQLHAEVTRWRWYVEKMTVSVTDTTNMRDETVGEV